MREPGRKRAWYSANRRQEPVPERDYTMGWWPGAAGLCRQERSSPAPESEEASEGEEDSERALPRPPCRLTCTTPTRPSRAAADPSPYASSTDCSQKPRCPPMGRSAGRQGGAHPLGPGQPGCQRLVSAPSALKFPRRGATATATHTP